MNLQSAFATHKSTRTEADTLLVRSKRNYEWKIYANTVSSPYHHKKDLLNWNRQKISWNLLWTERFYLENSVEVSTLWILLLWAWPPLLLPHKHQMLPNGEIYSINGNSLLLRCTLYVHMKYSILHNQSQWPRISMVFALVNSSSA